VNKRKNRRQIVLFIGEFLSIFESDLLLNAAVDFTWSCREKTTFAMGKKRRDVFWNKFEAAGVVKSSLSFGYRPKTTRKP
jgi:hypothetical protein